MDNNSMRGLFAFLLLAGRAFGQSGVPRLTGEGLAHHQDGTPVLLAPDQAVQGSVFPADRWDDLHRMMFSVL